MAEGRKGRLDPRPLPLSSAALSKPSHGVQMARPPQDVVDAAQDERDILGLGGRRGRWNGAGGAGGAGAYYTDPTIARFLVRFAIQGPSDTVLDPCFGEGVFLRSAANRLKELGGNAATQVTGIELDAGAHRATQATLASEGVIHRDMLHLADFFTRDPTMTGHFSAVVGNPPFLSAISASPGPNGPAPEARAGGRSASERSHQFVDPVHRTRHNLPQTPWAVGDGGACRTLPRGVCQAGPRSPTSAISKCTRPYLRPPSVPPS